MINVIKLIIIILEFIFFVGCSNFDANQSSIEKIAFVNRLLNEPENFNNIVKESNYYDSISYENLIDSKELKCYLEKMIILKSVTRLMIDNYSIKTPNIKSYENFQKLNILSFYYQGSEFGLDFHFGLLYDKWVLRSIGQNSYPIDFKLYNFYDSIENVIEKIKLNPEKFDQIIDSSNLLCKYYVNGNKYTTFFYKGQFISPKRIDIIKSNLDKNINLIELERGWTSPTLEPRYIVGLFFDNYPEILTLELILNECKWCIHEIKIEKNTYILNE